MGFRPNRYATVWEVTPGKGNYTTVRLSTSRKNRETGLYEQDFSGFCSFVGEANVAAQHLKRLDRILIEEMDVTTRPGTNKDGQPVTHTNFTVFKFSLAQPGPSRGGQPQQAQRAPQRQVSPLEQNPVDGGSNEAEDELPF